MMNQVFAKVARDPEKLNRFDYSDKGWECADRCFVSIQQPPATARWNVPPLTAGAARQGNYNEQTAAFLGLMWLYAVFCDAVAAAEHGLVYVGFRHAHPTPGHPVLSVRH